MKQFKTAIYLYSTIITEIIVINIHNIECNIYSYSSYHKIMISKESINIIIRQYYIVFITTIQSSKNSKLLEVTNLHSTINLSHVQLPESLVIVNIRINKSAVSKQTLTLISLNLEIQNLPQYSP